MHCQQETARFISQDLGGDFLFGLKGNQSGILERVQCKLSPVFFPPENETPWEKGHGQLVRRRIKTLEVSPEEIGLCGCWRIACVERATIDLTLPTAQQLPVLFIPSGPHSHRRAPIAPLHAPGAPTSQAPLQLLPTSRSLPHYGKIR